MSDEWLEIYHQLRRLSRRTEQILENDKRLSYQRIALKTLVARLKAQGAHHELFQERK